MVSHSRVRRVHPLLSLAGLAATPGMVPLTGNPPWRGWPHDKARAASPYHTPLGPAGFIDVSWNAKLYLDRMPRARAIQRMTSAPYSSLVVASASTTLADRRLMISDFSPHVATTRHPWGTRSISTISIISRVCGSPCSVQVSYVVVCTTSDRALALPRPTVWNEAYGL